MLFRSRGEGTIRAIHGKAKFILLFPSPDPALVRVHSPPAKPLQPLISHSNERGMGTVTQCYQSNRLIGSWIKGSDLWELKINSFLTVVYLLNYCGFMRIPSTKVKIPAFLVAASVVSGAFLVGHVSMADSPSTVVTPVSSPTVVVNRAITEEEVLAAQKAWGDALVSISTTYENKGIEAARALAEVMVRLSLPTILGELLAGVLIGVSGLHLIVPPVVQAELSSVLTSLVGSLAQISPAEGQEVYNETFPSLESVSRQIGRAHV